MIPETSDGRVLFAVPWHNEVVLGTTDTPVGKPSLEPRALEKEIDFILQTASGYLHNAPTRKDVLSVFAGLRPLAAPEKGSQKQRKYPAVIRSLRLPLIFSPSLAASGPLSERWGRYAGYNRATTAMAL